MTIVAIMGYPAAGKTSQVKEYTEQGFIRLNRDLQGRSIKDLHNELESKLKDGEVNFVLDNTYPTIASRAKLIELGKEYRVDVHCVHVTTSIGDAQVNACRRMMQRYGRILEPDDIKEIKDPNCFPVSVQYRYRKQFEKPTTKEGFRKVINAPFQRVWEDKYTNCLHWQ